MAFSTDGRPWPHRLDDDRHVRLWDVATGKPTATLPRSERPAWATRNRLVSPDGRYRVETDRPYDFKTLTILDAKTDGDSSLLEGHPDQLNDWAFAPGGIPGDRGGYTAHPWPVNPAGDVRIWDLKSGRLLARLDRHWGRSATSSSPPTAGRLLTASYEGTIMLWDVARILGQ